MDVFRLGKNDSKRLNPGRELVKDPPKHGSFSGFSENRGLRTPVFASFQKKVTVLSPVFQEIRAPVRSKNAFVGIETGFFGHPGREHGLKRGSKKRVLARF